MCPIDDHYACLEQAARSPGEVVRNQGDVAAAMQHAARRIEAEYYIPHMSQAPMEPPAATAQIVNGRCHTLVPGSVRSGAFGPTFRAR